MQQDIYLNLKLINTHQKILSNLCFSMEICTLQSFHIVFIVIHKICHSSNKLRIKANLHNDNTIPFYWPYPSLRTDSWTLPVAGRVGGKRGACRDILMVSLDFSTYTDCTYITYTTFCTIATNYIHSSDHNIFFFLCENRYVFIRWQFAQKIPMLNFLFVYNMCFPICPLIFACLH